MSNRIALLGILQSDSGGGDPCEGAPLFGPVEPPQFANCRNGETCLPGGTGDCYDRLYHDGCNGFVWITIQGACP